ncbi:polymerase [Pseudomonas chengduensis]
MNVLSNQTLVTLLEGAEIIEADGFGIKVARLEDGSFLKLYRRKRLLSSALWSPPAKRFTDNARLLRSLGVAAPEIRETISVPERQLNGVRYRPLPGDTLRELWRTSTPEDIEQDVEAFGRLLGELHGKGVYFRSLHLGNVIKMPDGKFGLIDLSDMHISGRPLSAWKRRRNIHHMLRYAEDAQWLARLYKDDLLRGYADRAGNTAAGMLRRVIDAQHPAPLSSTTSTS